MIIDDLPWRKATGSNGYGACVEFASIQGWVYVRDSKDPHGPVLRFPKAEWIAFLAGVKAGEFDDLV